MEWLSGIVTLGVQGATCLPAAKMSVGCVLVLGGRLSPPSSCGLASPDFCPPAGPAEFFGSKNAAIARQTRQPGSRPATRITPLCGVSAPKNHIDPCTPRVRSVQCHSGSLFLVNVFSRRSTGKRARLLLQAFPLSGLNAPPQGHTTGKEERRDEIKTA